MLRSKQRMVLFILTDTAKAMTPAMSIYVRCQPKFSTQWSNFEDKGRTSKFSVRSR